MVCIWKIVSTYTCFTLRSLSNSYISYDFISLSFSKSYRSICTNDFIGHGQRLHSICNYCSTLHTTNSTYSAISTTEAFGTNFDIVRYVHNCWCRIAHIAICLSSKCIVWCNLPFYIYNWCLSIFLHLHRLHWRRIEFYQTYAWTVIV